MERVLQIINKMGYGGIESFLMNMYRNVDKSTIQFDFACTSKEEGDYDNEIKLLGGNFYYFEKRRKNPIKYYQEWNQFLKNNAKNYTAISLNCSSLTSILPIVLAKKYGIKNRIIHAHSTNQRGMIHKILYSINKKRVLKYATKLLACSTEAGKFVFGKKSKFELFNNGINTDNFVYNEQIRNKIREEMKISKDCVALIHVGRFVYAKNHTFLIDIFNEIHKKNKNYKLFLAGTGILENEIKRKVNNLKLNDYIYFLENRNDINELLQGMDYFIFPSNYEGLPVTLIEAQASGIKIFASQNISQEVKITDLVNFMPLEIGPEQWAKEILNQRKYERKNMRDVIIEKGYDVKELSSKLASIYLK